MAGCEYYQELMSRLMDGSLSDREQAELHEHVRACPDCARLLAVFSGMTVALRDDIAPAPEDLSARVMARIAMDWEKRDAESAPPPEKEADDTGAPEPIPFREAKKKRSPIWGRAAVAACLALALGGAAFGLVRGRLNSQTDSAEAAPMAVSVRSGEADQAVLDMAEAAEEAQPIPDPLDVRDIAGKSIGYIPGEDAADFAALLDESQPSEDSWEMLCTVSYQGKTYAFGVDEEGKAMAWWDTALGDAYLCPGTWPELRALIVSTVDTKAGQ